MILYCKRKEISLSTIIWPWFVLRGLSFISHQMESLLILLKYPLSYGNASVGPAVSGHSFSEKSLRVSLTGLALSVDGIDTLLNSPAAIPALQSCWVFILYQSSCLTPYTQPISLPMLLEGKLLGDYVLSCFTDPQKDISRKPRSHVSTRKAEAEFWLCLPDETAGWESSVRRLEEG